MNKQVKWGVVLTYLALFSNIGLSLLYTPLMLRALGPSEHGLYGTVSSVIAWLSILGLGFGTSYIRYYTQRRNSERELANLNGLFLLLFTVIGFIALICGIIIAHNIEVVFNHELSTSELAKARVLAYITTVDFAISFPASLFGSILRAHEQFIQIKIIQIFQCIFSPLLTLPLLYLGYGSVAMVSVTTVVDIVAYSMNIYYCFRILKVSISLEKLDIKLLKDLSSFSLFIALNTIISQVNNTVGKVCLAKFVTTESVSIYTIGFSLYTYYSTFASAVTAIFVPKIHRVANALQTELINKNLTEQFTKLGRFQFYIQGLMLLGLLAFGKQFIILWAGDTYVNSYAVMWILCLANTIPLMQSTGIEIQRAMNKHRARTKLYLLMAVVNILLTIYMCQHYGEIGAAFSTACSIFLVEVVFMNFYYHYVLRINMCYFWKNIFRISIGVLIPFMYSLFLIFNSQQEMLSMKHFIHIIPFTLIYVFSVYFLSMSKEERSLANAFLINK